MISIIMPTYNQAAYISEAIRSCLNQTHSDIELVIVDDGSTDSTKRVVDWHMTRDGRIKFFHQSNQGPASAMNYGISQALGDIICFAASDDVQLGDKVSILVKTFKQKIDFAYTGYFHANVHAQPWQEVHPKPLTLENIKKNDCAAGGALAFRKTIPVRFREYMKVNEDQAFLFDLYKSKLRYALVDIPTFNYRLLPTGMSYSRKEEVEQSTKELIREIEDYEAQNLGS